MRNKKGNIVVIFLAVALIASISAAGYLFVQNKQLQNQVVVTPTQTQVATPAPTLAPTPDPTANWKTYTNTPYGFDFKYPENQYNKQNPVQANPTGCQKLDQTGCVNPEAYYFSVVKSCDKMSCNDMFEVYVYLDPNNPNFLRDMNNNTLYGETTTDTTFAGLPAKKKVYNLNNNSVGSGPMYYIPGHKNSFVIHGDPNDPVFEQILSTFKFL